MDVDVAADLPAHWDVSSNTSQEGVQLVELSGFQNLRPVLEAAAAARGVSERSISRVAKEGLSNLDAIAALLLEGCDLSDAMLRAFAYSHGKPGTLVCRWLEQCSDLPEAERRSHLQSRELDVVLDQLTEASGGLITRDRVVSVGRVQHPKLWRQYVAVRDDIIYARGEEGLNERLMFHGTGPGAVDAIVSSGFDLTYCNAHSSFGKGHYFTDLSSTALGYSTSKTNHAYHRVQQAAAAAAAAAAVGQDAAARHLKMIVARVALGNQTHGRSGMVAAPQGYDSVHSSYAYQNAANPGSMFCHVVFDNDQCYPEYVVTLTDVRV